MKIFRKNKERSLTEGQERVATRLAMRIIRNQRRVADYLNARTAGLSGKCWLWLLILFCASFGSYCLLLLSSALFK